VSTRLEEARREVARLEAEQRAAAERLAAERAAAEQSAQHAPAPAGAPQTGWSSAALPAPGPQGPGDGSPVAPGDAADRPRRRLWLPVTSAAAAAALVAAFGTLGISHALDGDPGTGTRPASIAELGRDSSDTVPVSGSTAQDPNWEAVTKAVSPSVVAISVTTSQGGAQGSGVVIDDEGRVVTNNHVVAGADTVQVTLSDGRIYPAKVVGTDPTTDLAVVQLQDPPDDLRPAALGDSAGVTVGEPVMAVGNPLGLANTVTTGIVSAVDRPVTTQGEGGSDATVTNAIQVDAAVNPGNSGGPLFDAEGRVIGINSSIATLSSGSGSIGLGFAIPVNLVKNIASQLIDSGVAKHAFLGVGLDDGTATADGVTRAGALVKTVSDGSPAAAAGLKEGDVIVAIGDKPVGGAESLTAYVRSYTAGDTVTLTVVRDGKALEVDATLATKEDAASSSPQQGQGDQGQGGQGQPGQDGQGQPGQGGRQLPGGMTPDELWEWLQQQQGQG
jgi:putative serine protease PepD